MYTTSNMNTCTVWLKGTLLCLIGVVACTWIILNFPYSSTASFAVSSIWDVLNAIWLGLYYLMRSCRYIAIVLSGIGFDFSNYLCDPTSSPTIIVNAYRTCKACDPQCPPNFAEYCMISNFNTLFTMIFAVFLLFVTTIICFVFVDFPAGLPFGSQTKLMILFLILYPACSITHFFIRRSTPTYSYAIALYITLLVLVLVNRISSFILRPSPLPYPSYLLHSTTTTNSTTTNSTYGSYGPYTPIPTASPDTENDEKV